MRITGNDYSSDDGDVTEVFRQQIARWGTTLKPYEVYARRPSIFKAVVGMWDGLKTSGLLDGKLRALINRRVAVLNGCVF
ncbi:MAG: carboxymuconolactone decarboxylase family protein [Planctomycetales bacterium]|nr:carboxymuconolactone decarboxylase family protein [Planctomycetales bacterium]